MSLQFRPIFNVSMIKSIFNTPVKTAFKGLTRYHLYINQRCMAGHSKWANIKHIKALKDGQRAANFLKLAQQIRVAIQEGKSANPSSNFQLNQAIEVAKKQNMPVEKIQNILKSAQNSKNEQGKSGVVEVRGPGGCWILVSILTDNINRTRNLLQPVIRKANCTLSDGGAAKHSFHHKGVVLATAKNGSSSIDTSLEHAIETGAEDVVWDKEQKVFNFTCEPLTLHTVRLGLQGLGYEIQDARVTFIPHTFAELNEQQLQAVSALCDKLQENPEVVCLYDNIA